MIREINYPLIEVQTNGLVIQTVMLPLSTRNNFVNYTSGSGQLLTLNGSLISKTNGMDVNLISLYINPESPLIKKTDISNWTKDKFYKEYKFIKTTYMVETIKFECRFENFLIDEIFILEELSLTKVTEVCENKKYKF